MQEPSFDPTERGAADWMREMALLPLDAPPLPDATVLWWKGQARRRVDAERRLTAPLDATERINVGLAILGAIVLVAQLAAFAPQSLTSPVSILSISFGALLIVIAVTLRSIATRALR